MQSKKLRAHRSSDPPDPLTSDIHVSTIKPSFEWDSRKARTNAAKHGVTFELARTAFDDPDNWVTSDRPHSSSAEHREWLIGMTDAGLVVVVFTRRSSGRTVRLISARKAGRRDRRKYEAGT